MTWTLLALAISAGSPSGFPRAAGGPIARSAIGVSVEGAPAVVVAAGEEIQAFRADGSRARGFPLALGAQETAAGAPAAADMDGDRRPEIAVATESGRLFVWSGATPVPGFPVRLGARVQAGPSFADVDGDGHLEVLVGDDAGRLHAFKKGGREAKGWPVSLGAPVTSPASSSRFAGGLSVAVGCQDGQVHVLDGSGRERKGFPLRTRFAVTGPPAFADLDDDGSMDLVVGSQDFKLYAVNAQGEPLPGFPVAAGYRIYDGPAIADLAGDGHLDAIFTSADGWVHAVDGRGQELRGFPVRLATRFFGGPAVGDVDRDGRLEVVVASADGQVVALSPEGKSLPGFPVRLDAAELSATPLLYDLDQDGGLSVVLGLPSGELHVLRARRAGDARAAAPWPGAAGGAAHAGRYGPNPPRYLALALGPERPRFTDRLVPSWRYQALDAAPGEPEPAPRIEWLRDGKPVPQLEGRREVPPRVARKGERWSFVLGPPGGTRAARSPEVRIEDTPPGPPRVALDTEHPSKDRPVRLSVTAPAADADGDPIEYRVEWLQDGVPTGVSGTVFPGDQLRRGALLTARVTASDGELSSEPVAAEAVVANTAPGAPAVAIDPPSPRVASAIAARIVRPAADPDGDPVSYHYRWQVGGERRNLPLATATLPPGTAKKGQKVLLEVRAFDGLLEGPPAVAEATVANSPPGVPGIEIWPKAPRRGDALRAVILAPAPDADGDALDYAYRWTKNGQAFEPRGDPREIPGAETRLGDRFELQAWARDGEAEGPRARATAVVGHTPPTAPLLAIEPARPRGGDPLRMRIARPSEDVDGDQVRYDVAWYRDGKPIAGESGETLPARLVRKHEKVRVTVTPRDGHGAGPAGSAEVVVENAPPAAPRVALRPERPTVAAPLRAEVVEAAADADGDRIAYRYRWTRDGSPVAVPDGGPESRRAPYWTSSAEVPARDLEKGKRWAVEVQAFDGEVHGPPARAEAVVRDSPPPAPSVSLAPEGARRVDGLRAVVAQPPDPDGDLVTHRYRWRRDGAPVSAPPEQSRIPRGLARKGERWQVEVVASDGEEESAPARAEVVIANTRPGPVAIALCDRPVPEGTPLEARIVQPATDADGDAVTYRYDWSVNGQSYPVAKNRPGLAGTALRKHDLVRVVVTPWDGEEAGPEATAECLVENTPPSAPEIAIEPREPSAGTGMTAAIRRRSGDRDGDVVSYRYQWFRDGLPAGIEANAVPAGVPHHGETWRVVVTPWDGEAAGESVAASAVVKNTPPPVPAVTLRPEAPTVGQALTCQARVAERDADGEPVEVRYRWFVNGAPVALAEGRPELPAGVVRHGERWRCEAWSSDGAALSARAGAEVLVRNSPPAAPQVAIEPETPRRGDRLHCRIAVEAADPDGDRVGYQYAWWRNDSPVAAGPDPASIPPERLAKGQRWRCQVTPSDGSLQGRPGRAEVTVANSPPGPARVRVVPPVPRPGELLRCEIVARSQDPDGDAVRYRFGWFLNGRQQPFAESSEEVPSRLVRRGDRWRCQAIPSDGEANGPVAPSTEVQVMGPSTEGRETTGVTGVSTLPSSH